MPREAATFRLLRPAPAARRAPANRPASPATRAAAPANGRARPRSPSSDVGAAGGSGRTAPRAKKASGAARTRRHVVTGAVGRGPPTTRLPEKWAAGWGPPLRRGPCHGGSASRGRSSRGTQRWRYRMGRRYGSPALRRTGDPGSANVPRRPAHPPGCDGPLESVCHVGRASPHPKGVNCITPGSKPPTPARDGVGGISGSARVVSPEQRWKPSDNGGTERPPGAPTLGGAARDHLLAGSSFACQVSREP